MLSKFAPVTTIPSGDITRSRAFYEGVLGFSETGSTPDGGVEYRSGPASFIVYPSSYAGTNQATTIGFSVDDTTFDEEVARLREHGVTFDEFEAEGATWTDGVLEMTGMRAVWFRDPDGNIISLWVES